MRLRNIPRAGLLLQESRFVVDNPSQYKGNWRSYFQADRPLHVEIGMGKGQFITALARNHPDISYIGLEKFESVLLRGVQKMDAEPLENLRFLREYADTMADMFAEGEIERIYLNFSDPWPKDRHAKRRLTAKGYLSMYHKILKDKSQLVLKTDNESLFDFTLEQVEESPFTILSVTRDLHRDPEQAAENIMTEYEERFVEQGKPIYKMIAINNK